MKHAQTSPGARRRGSVLLLVVGLLTILAMLGGSFVLVARMNQRTSRAINESTPPDAVAQGILQRLITDRVRDLHFVDPAIDPNALPYSNIQRPEDAIDYPGEPFSPPAGGTVWYDQALACIEPELYMDSGGTPRLRWRHLSHLPGSRLYDPIADTTNAFRTPMLPTYTSDIEDVPGNVIEDVNGVNNAINDDIAREYVDTDGIAYEWDLNVNNIIDPLEGERLAKDARLFDSGVFDRNGNEYRVAVRMIDASGLVNVNTAGMQNAGDFLATMLNPANGFRAMAPASGVSLLPQLYEMYVRSAMTPANASTAAGITLQNLIGNRRGAAANDLSYADGYVRMPLAPTVNALPYDAGDALALLWRAGDMAVAGRAVEQIRNVDPAAVPYRPLLTTWSASRAISPPFGGSPTSEPKVDLNLGAVTAPADKDTRLRALQRAFYRALPPGIVGLTDGLGILPWGGGADPIDTQRTMLAAQLAVNVWDYVDLDSEPTYLTGIVAGNGTVITYTGNISSATVYGVERQLFITEVAYHVVDDFTRYYAIELYNPYDTPIDLTNYVLKMGALPPYTIIKDNWGDVGNALGPMQRLVITNNQGSVAVASGNKVTEVPGLALVKYSPIQLTYKFPLGVGNAEEIRLDTFRMDAIPAWTEDDPGAYLPSATGMSKAEALRRGQANGCKDAVPSALQLFSTAPLPPGTPVAVNLTVAPAPGEIRNNLGLGNDQPVPEGFICPVFVRDKPFVNVGELSRIFYVGPTLDDPANPQPRAFTMGIGDDIHGGRVSHNFGAILATGDLRPAVPIEALWSECFMVASPYYDGQDNDGDSSIDSDADEGVVYGRININTATFDALRSLPPLAAMGVADFGTWEQYDPAVAPAGPYARDAIAREIIAYRDLRDNDAMLPPTGTYPDNVPGTGGGLQYETLGRPVALGGGPFADLRSEPGFVAAGECAIPLYRRAAGALDFNLSLRLPQNSYNLTRLPPYPYLVGQDLAGALTGSDDGLEPMISDPTKDSIYYSWLSNQVTVRSDTYIAYIFVEDPARRGEGIGRRYVALIDRSRCWRSTDPPRILMFSQIK